MKTSTLDPLRPSRADQRLIHKILDTSYSGSVVHTNDGYEIVTRVFQRAGGSWERLFLGSYKDLGLLKLVIKVAVQKNYIPKASVWR